MSLHSISSSICKSEMGEEPFDWKMSLFYEYECRFSNNGLLYINNYINFEFSNMTHNFKTYLNSLDQGRPEQALYINLTTTKTIIRNTILYYSKVWKKQSSLSYTELYPRLALNVPVFNITISIIEGLQKESIMKLW